ncbi:Uma2 family endonuclease [Roseisolibacter sp. H3M3-2]|uniref:Uma2 family endonuclease n=1 Tax=Roseisolibacter sp. H3M3-2 TaxID=3031323 RepID=UPI0023DB33E1|nr:Uma2 family endonuclease [Roseisolibacter sp. H3M3-2]MDF1501569.1 Uma2 family endonuclease [Roseisolibacter sp. H3M3-2]
MTTPERFITPQEYLRLERAAEARSEYYRGRVYAMSGASRQHARIVLNLGVALHGQLAGGACEPFVADLRTKVRASGFYTYPDVVVSCGDAETEDELRDTLLNPALIVEVLSPSTEAYDRGEKFALYRELDTLRTYVLVAQDRPHVEVFEREGDRWMLREVSGIDATLDLPTIGASVPLRELYARVEWPENPPLRVVREEALV